MADRRSKRQRKQPEFFGRAQAEAELEASLGPGAAPVWPPRLGQHSQQGRPSPPAAPKELEELQASSSDEEAPPKKARQHRRAAEEDWEAGEEAEEEEGATAAPGRRRGGGHGGRQKQQEQAPQRQQHSAPAPPAAPMDRQDFIAALHACPMLLDAILKPDGLRTVTLLARDAANLAIALGCTPEEMGGAWRVLAGRAAGGVQAAGGAQDGFSGTDAEALAAVRAAVHDDPARQQRCTMSNAKSDWRLSDKDLAGLDFISRHNPIFYSAAPTKLYRLLDCLAIAHRKFGDLAGIQAAKQAGKQRGAKVKATRKGNEERRKEEIRQALADAELTQRQYERSREVKAFVKHGRTTASAVVAGFVKANEEAARRNKRLTKLRAKLAAAGLREEGCHGGPAARYLNGEKGVALADAVADAKQRKEEREGKAQRRTALQQALLAAQLLPPAGTPEAQTLEALRWDSSYHGFQGAFSYIQDGKGSVAEVVEAARLKAEGKAQQEQRRAELQQALVAAGLLPAEGSPEAEGGPAGGFLGGNWGVSYGGVQGAYDYIQHSRGSVAEVVEAGRQKAAEETQRAQRRARLEQALVAAGLQQGLESYRYSVPHFYAYAQSGTGFDSHEGAIEAVRLHQHRLDQQEQRRQRLRQLLEAEGVQVPHYAYASSMLRYIRTGEGSDAELLAAGREVQLRMGQQGSAGERRQRVTQLLVANGLPTFYAFTCSTIAYYIETGNGSDAAALADAKKHHESKGQDDGAAVVTAAAAAAAADADAEDAMQE